MKPIIKVVIERGESDRREYSFSDSFCIGRDDSCDIQIDAHIVSRKHIEVYFERGRWWVEDNNSANGTYVDGEKIDRISVSGKRTIELGSEGPRLSFYSEGPVAKDQPDEPKGDLSVSQVMEKYFDSGNNQEAGLHTMMVRQAFQHVQKKQKKKYIYVIAVVVILFVITGGYAIRQHKMLQEQKQLAKDMFYKLKEIELDLAQQAQVNPDDQSNLLSGMQQYDRFLDKLGVYGKGMSREEQLISKVARIFGECDVELPRGFVGEVKKYINKWITTGWYEQGINRAKRNNYIGPIVKEFKKQGLPPQFFYIALQESGFRNDACGPLTRSGLIAKGMWQFIPGTAKDYGLHVGPLSKERIADPEDERHDFQKATNAAARYIKYIYTTDCRASGLLVIASYNWGERSVANLIKKMSQNPKECNFWKLLEALDHKFPTETYDYVFYIFSAAVIGEDPGAFGFNFNNPLESAAAFSQ